MARGWLAATIVTGLLLGAIGAPAAQSMKERVNRGVVGVIAGSIDGTSMHAASDLAWVLDAGEQLRVLPIQGKGSVQAITDLLYLRGIDIGIIQRDALEYSRRQAIHANLEGRTRYIARLFNEEVHILARRDIGTLAELAGQPVNIGTPGSGSDLTATLIFEALGLEVEVRQLDHALALQQLIAGELAGMVYIGGQPAPLFQHLDAAAGLHLLPIAYTPELLELYLPANLTSDSYPGLVPAAGRVDTLAVEAIMAVYNWPADHARYAKVARFVETFFARLPDLQQPPRHRKWQDVRLEAEFPGWQRFAPAAEQLQKISTAAADADPLNEAFQRFMAERDLAAMPDDLKRSLFLEFLRWQHGEAPGQAEPYTFALVPKTVNNAFFTVGNEGCQQAAAESPEIECLYIGPGEYTEQEQAQILQDLIDRGIDGIALSPLLAGVLRRAEEADIPVITWDADLEESDRDLRRTYIGSDNYEIGVQIALMAQQLKPGGGTFCILTVAKESTNTNRRIEGIRDTLAGRPGVARLQGEQGWQEAAGCPLEHQGDVATAMQQINQLLTEQPNLDTVLSVAATPQRSDTDYRAVMAPFRDRLASGRLVMVMADTLPHQIAQLQDGLSHVQVGQRPFEMGYRAMFVLKSLVEGNAVLEDPIYTALDVCVPANAESCVFGPDSVGRTLGVASR